MFSLPGIKHVLVVAKETLAVKKCLTTSKNTPWQPATILGVNFGHDGKACPLCGGASLSRGIKYQLPRVKILANNGGYPCKGNLNRILPKSHSSLVSFEIFIFQPPISMGVKNMMV